MVGELRREGVDDRVVARALRRLVSLDESAGGRIVARTVALAAFPPGTPDWRFVDAFLRMRLLVAEGDEEQARVRVAHEALLIHWDRAGLELNEAEALTAAWADELEPALSTMSRNRGRPSAVGSRSARKTPAGWPSGSPRRN